MIFMQSSAMIMVMSFEKKLFVPQDVEKKLFVPQDVEKKLFVPQDVEKNVLECRARLKAITDTQGKGERAKAEQSAKEIKLRCERLLGKVNDTPTAMSSSQLKCMPAKDASNRLDDLNETLANALEKKGDFIKTVRQVLYRNLSEEKKSKMRQG